MLADNRNMIRNLALAALISCTGEPLLAHASEQGFVLLLPTGHYIAGGVATVAATVLLISTLPAEFARRLFQPIALLRRRVIRGRKITNILAFVALLALLWQGFTGPHDPNRNALPLAVWSMFWVAFITAQGVFGDLWRWVNPWTGAWALWPFRPVARLPDRVGHWPALVGFMAFAAVLLAHPSPAEPETLAAMTASYWAVHFVGMIIFGPSWLRRGEAMTVVLGCYATLAPLGTSGGRWRIGLPGWQLLSRSPPKASLAILMLAMLAVGSFDGLNETFWWFAQIGINPLEFPGRSFVVWQNLAGLALALPLLIAAYGISVWLGARLIGESARFGQAFCALAPAILPIALGYHIGHYLPGFLVEIQYAGRLVADWFGLAPITVTTGFFNTLATVQLIWLSQAGAVLVGHIVAILLGHVLALRLFGSPRRAAISQVPLAAFMVGYTLFGLWLLASPRGV